VVDPFSAFLCAVQVPAAKESKKAKKTRWRFVLLYTPDEFVRRLKKRGGLH
jgi:hypothetical protein